MELMNGDNMEGGEDVGHLEIEPLHEDMVKISFHAILGKTNEATMKRKGMLGGGEVFLLVDNGFTHNFISNALVF